MFHTYASVRKKKNSITHLKDDMGRVCTWNDGLPELIQLYFSDLFRSRGCHDSAVLDTVSRKLTDQQNSFLIRRLLLKRLRRQ